MGVPKALDLSLLVGYLFVRSFLFMLKLGPPPPYLHPFTRHSNLFHRVTLSPLPSPPSPHGPLNDAVIAAEKRRGTLCRRRRVGGGKN